jgi:hypothetical protein
MAKFLLIKIYVAIPIDVNGSIGFLFDRFFNIDDLENGRLGYAQFRGGFQNRPRLINGPDRKSAAYEGLSDRNKIWLHSMGRFRTCPYTCRGGQKHRPSMLF